MHGKITSLKQANSRKDTVHWCARLQNCNERFLSHAESSAFSVQARRALQDALDVAGAARPVMKEIRLRIVWTVFRLSNAPFLISNVSISASSAWILWARVFLLLPNSRRLSVKALAAHCLYPARSADGGRNFGYRRNPGAFVALQAEAYFASPSRSALSKLVLSTTNGAIETFCRGFLFRIWSTNWSNR